MGDNLWKILCWRLACVTLSAKGQKVEGSEMQESAFLYV